MPYPNTIGGALMGYPTTVDNGLVAPLVVFTPGIENSTGTFTVSAGQAYASLYTLLASVTLTQMRCCFSGSPTGNIDLGIYDSTGTNGGPGNLQGHTGANAAATGVFTKSLTANVLLSPGNYWIAFLSTIANSVFGRQASGAGMIDSVISSTTGLTVLPSSFGAFTDSNLVTVLCLVSGGFS